MVLPASLVGSPSQREGMQEFGKEAGAKREVPAGSQGQFTASPEWGSHGLLGHPTPGTGQSRGLTGWKRQEEGVPPGCHGCP